MAALFSRKKKDTIPTKGKKTGPEKTVRSATRAVLIAPRVTEKAVIGTPENVYAFDILPDATKPEVAAAVQAEFNVTPIKVRISKIPTKTIVRRAGTAYKEGTKGGGKKAYVYLKEGDTIAFA